MAFKEMREIFTNAILEVKADPTLIKDDQKRSVAIAKIKAQLTAKGKELGDNTINVFLEIFVAYLKKKGLL
jgi:hypothetical protein